MDNNTPKQSTDATSNKRINDIKSSIRPVLTYLFTFLYIYVFIKRSDMETVYINGLNDIMIVIIIFWFGERLMRNTGITDFLLNYNKKVKQ